MPFTAEEIANINAASLENYIEKGTVFKQNVANKPMLKAFDEARGSFSGGNTYVSLAGTGSVERDPAKKRELWSKLNEAFAGEVDDPNNVVLTVTIASGEYWDGGNSVAQAIRVALDALLERDELPKRPGAR